MASNADYAVVTGMGSVSPHGRSVATLWSNLLQGKSAFSPLTLFDALRSGADGYLDKGSAWAELVPIVAELCTPSMSPT